jgi:tripartite-type tricarboxylate transporter receptor subunit TctC
MKRLITVGCLLLTAATWPVGAYAQSAWPQAPIKIITPTPAGVGTDVFARIYASNLAKVLNTTAYVENRPGASSTIAAAAVAKADPNGFTLLLSISLPLTTAPALFSKLPYDAGKDFAPVAQLYRGGSFLIANNSFAGNSLEDLVLAAKRKPKSINYASYGPGSTAHLGFELIQDAAGIELVHVPYKTSAVPDLMRGEITVGWEPAVSAMPFITDRKIKALAYTGNPRSPALPDVAALAESFPGLEVFTWVGLWAPAGTPDAILDSLHDAIETINRVPAVIKALSDASSEPMRTTRAQMAVAIENETRSMGRLIKAKNIKLD